MEHYIGIRLDHGLYTAIEKQRRALNKAGHFEIGLSEFVRGMVRIALAEQAKQDGAEVSR